MKILPREMNQRHKFQEPAEMSYLMVDACKITHRYLHLRTPEFLIYDLPLTVNMAQDLIHSGYHTIAPVNRLDILGNYGISLNTEIVTHLLMLLS